MNHTRMAEIYRLAADDLERNGRARGHLTNDHGQHCLVGALNAAGVFQNTSAWNFEFEPEILAEIHTVSPLRSRFIKLADVGYSAIVTWNDTTLSDSKVIRVLRNLESKHARKAIQELQAKVHDLEIDIATLKNDITTLKTEVTFWKRAFRSASSEKTQERINKLEAELSGTIADLDRMRSMAN